MLFNSCVFVYVSEIDIFKLGFNERKTFSEFIKFGSAP